MAWASTCRYAPIPPLRCGLPNTATPLCFHFCLGLLTTLLQENSEVFTLETKLWRNNLCIFLKSRCVLNQVSLFLLVFGALFQRMGRKTQNTDKPIKKQSLPTLTCIHFFYFLPSFFIPQVYQIYYLCTCLCLLSLSLFLFLFLHHTGM